MHERRSAGRRIDKHIDNVGVGDRNAVQERTRPRGQRKRGDDIVASARRVV